VIVFSYNKKSVKTIEQGWLCSSLVYFQLLHLFHLLLLSDYGIIQSELNSCLSLWN